MKRIVLTAGLLLFLAPLDAEAPDEFGMKLARFHEHYDKFVRTFLGCPKDAGHVEECKPNLGTFDFREFRFAKEGAMPLFDLERKD